MTDYRFSDAYYRVQHGFLGELKFFNLFKIAQGHLELFNININVDGYQFEVDRLIITGEAIYAFDVKHYSAPCVDESEYWRNKYSSFKSPMSQFTIMKDGLKVYVHYHQLTHRLVCKLVFISEHFYIDRKTDEILYFKDIAPLFRAMKQERVVSAFEFTIQKHLMGLHRPINYYNLRPEFNMDTLRKGIICERCAMQIDFGQSSKRLVCCEACGNAKTKEKWIRQTLTELALLLNRPFSAKEAYKWTGRSNRHITKRVLDKYFEKIDDHYILNEV
ncbi:nuclease-related domain-containing protein [Macrococcoides goetzii]|nr:nuclease-related domain-containing protein [Macrococcus goetzii]